MLNLLDDPPRCYKEMFRWKLWSKIGKVEIFEINEDEEEQDNYKRKIN